MASYIKTVLLVAGFLSGVMLHAAIAADFGPITPHDIIRYTYVSEDIHIDLSADGRVIVGNKNQYGDPFYLNLNCGILCVPPRDGSYQRDFKFCSGDGALVTGQYHVYKMSSSNCTCQVNSQTDLENPAGEEGSVVHDISVDGSTVVGYGYHQSVTSTTWNQAVRWDTSTGAATGIGVYGGDDDCRATAVSADGQVILGASGSNGDFWRPVFWRPTYGWYPLERIYLGPYPSWEYWSLYGNTAHGMSNDGQLAVGNLINDTHIVPVFWNLNPAEDNFTKATLLPLLYGSDHVAGRAYASSRYIPGHGYTIGGYSGSDNRQFGGAGHYPLVSEAVLWETEHLQTPPTRVETLLQGLGLGNKIAGWKLTEVLSISDNGKTLVGRGIHPNGQYWYWYADLSNPPPNDTREHAQYIGQSTGNLFTGRYKTGGTTVDASPSITPIVTEGSKLRPTVWYSYKAEQNGYLSLDLAGTVSFSLLAVYREQETTPMITTGTCSDPNSVGPCFVPDELKINANTMYYISVSGMEGPQGEESFDLYHQFTPITDQCVDAFFLEQNLPQITPGSTNDAVTASAPVCNGVTVTAPGVWFKVVGTGGYMTASLDGAADYDTKLSVYCAGCSGSPTCITANDDINGQYNKTSKVGWCSKSGNIYHILVHGYGTAAGNFSLTVGEDNSVTCTPASTIDCGVTNTECSSSVPLVENHTLLVDNTNAGTNVSTTQCGQVNNDIWFSYTARCNGQVIIDTCQSQGSLDNTVLAVFDGCGGNELACNNNNTQQGCSGLRSAIFLQTHVGQKLKILAADYGISADEGTFPLRVQEDPDDVDILEMTLADTYQGSSVNIQLQISGGCPRPGVEYMAHVTNGALPPGLSLDWKGLLSGTATTSGRYEFTVRVSDGEMNTGHYDSASYVMTILPANDICMDSASIGEGLVLFGNYGADTSGTISPQCDGSEYSSDIWFSYTASCNGLASASTCGSDFDTTVAVYAGSDCSAVAPFLGCNIDNAGVCGPGASGSSMTFAVKAGEKYHVRVASDKPSGGRQGNGKLLITCFDDCNNNKVSDLFDIISGSSYDKNKNGIPDECEPSDFSWSMFLPAITGHH